MMAKVVRISLEDSLFSSGMSGLLKRREEIKKLLARGDLSFFYSRICSIEIVRDERLERLYFLPPEACARLQKEPAFLERVEKKLFQDLETENDERQKSLLERMTLLSDELQSEFELASGPPSSIRPGASLLPPPPLSLPLSLLRSRPLALSLSPSLPLPLPLPLPLTLPRPLPPSLLRSRSLFHFSLSRSLVLSFAPRLTLLPPSPTHPCLSRSRSIEIALSLLLCMYLFFLAPFPPTFVARRR